MATVIIFTFTRPFIRRRRSSWTSPRSRRRQGRPVPSRAESVVAGWRQKHERGCTGGTAGAAANAVRLVASAAELPAPPVERCPPKKGVTSRWDEPGTEPRGGRIGG